MFFQTVSDYVDNHAPLKKMNKKDLKLQSKPWINSKILQIIKYRDRLKWKLIRSLLITMNICIKSLEIAWLANLGLAESTTLIDILLNTNQI